MRRTHSRKTAPDGGAIIQGIHIDDWSRGMETPARNDLSALGEEVERQVYAAIRKYVERACRPFKLAQALAPERPKNSPFIRCDGFIQGPGVHRHESHFHEIAQGCLAVSFTVGGLRHLYKKPKAGKACYTPDIRQFTVELKKGKGDAYEVKEVHLESCGFV